jgi:glycosyltransferase involved in cell wall biosynthesis
MRYAWHLREEYFADRGHSEAYGVISGRMLKAPVSAARNLVLDRLQSWDRQTADRVTHFVAISRTVAGRIAECYGRESTIIYPPVDTEFYTPDDGPRDDYYLCVSALAPYKRIELAVEACNRLQRRLVVIGQGPEHVRLKCLAGPHVSMLGWQSDETIRSHLRRCRALLFPGHEDFGIVPLEAQACGAPVIALAAGGATETILPGTPDQPGTGVFFSEATVEALCQAMTELEQSPSACSPILARRQAERFNKQRYERELVTLLEQVAGHS